MPPGVQNENQTMRNEVQSSENGVQPTLIPTVPEGELGQFVLRRDRSDKELSNDFAVPDSVLDKSKFIIELENKPWSHHQDGTGGAAKKYIDDDGLRGELPSIRIEPSSKGNSLVRYEISDIEEFKGQNISFRIWVKSQNTVADAIQIDIQDGIGPVAVKFYPNSEQWEHVQVSRYVDPSAVKLFLTANVKANANDGAYFNEPVLIETKFRFK
jgi:hypothetical protein